MQKVVGIHLSSFKSKNTALAFLKRRSGAAADGGEAENVIYELSSVYERVGSSGAMSGDDRISAILACEGQMHEIFVDCPLNVPPCVSCRLPSCPGLARCPDVRVAYMQSVQAGSLLKKPAKRRMINPQAQRVWDVFQTYGLGQSGQEPVFGTTNAPLAVRALTLARRLREGFPDLTLKEASVPAFIQELAAAAGVPALLHYRDFEAGGSSRRAFLDLVIDDGALGFRLGDLHGFRAQAAESLPVFSALVTALMAACYLEGRAAAVPPALVDLGEQVYFPDLRGMKKNPAIP